MDTLGHAGKFSSMNFFSSGVPYTSFPAANLVANSGKSNSPALMILFTFHMKRPAFQ